MYDTKIMKAFETLIHQSWDGAGTGCLPRIEDSEDNSDEDDLRPYESCLIFSRELYCIFRE